MGRILRKKNIWNLTEQSSTGAEYSLQELRISCGPGRKPSSLAFEASGNSAIDRVESYAKFQLSHCDRCGNEFKRRANIKLLEPPQSMHKLKSNHQSIALVSDWGWIAHSQHVNGGFKIREGNVGGWTFSGEKTSLKYDADKSAQPLIGWRCMQIPWGWFQGVRGESRLAHHRGLASRPKSGIHFNLEADCVCWGTLR